MNMNIYLKNDFHHTAVTVRVGEDLLLSARQVRRAWRALCGFSACHCSDACGLRGVVDVESDSGLAFVEHFDGSGHFERIDRDGAVAS